ncbi:MAG: carboxypeptidase regulatory-like domain-containing protein [Longimicrobiales bacterium]
MSKNRGRGWLLFAASVAAGVFLPTPSGAQAVLIRGRVEDALSRTPLVGARVMAIDSSAVYTDSIGQFSIEMETASSYELGIQLFGYAEQQFGLPEEAPSRVSVLLLAPDPVQLEVIEVASEPAVNLLLDRLRARRRGYDGSVIALDKAFLNSRWPIGTAWDVVVARAPVFECDSIEASEQWPFIKSDLCVRGRRTRRFNDPLLGLPGVPVLVCIDQWESWGAASELSTLDVSQIALIEIYARGYGGIRVYTSRYLASSAGSGRNIATPVWIGC